MAYASANAQEQDPCITIKIWHEDAAISMAYCSDAIYEKQNLRKALAICKMAGDKARSTAQFAIKLRDTPPSDGALCVAKGAVFWPRARDLLQWNSAAV